MSLPGQHFRKSDPWRLRIGERRIVLLTGDLIASLFALGVALYIWGSRLRFIQFDIEFLRQRVPFWFYLLPVIWIALLLDLYDVHRAGDWGRTVRGIIGAAVVAFGLYLIFYFFYPDLLPRVSVGVFIILVSLLTLFWRRIYIRIFADPQFMRRVLLVGGGNAGQDLLKVINDLWPPPFFVAGIIDDDPQKLGKEIEGYQVYGNCDTLLSIIDEQNISDIIVAISGQLHSGMFQSLLEAQERGVDILRLPRVFEDLVGRVPIMLLEADWVIRSFVDDVNSNQFYEMVKRLLDILGGLVGVIALLILLPFIGVAIFVDDGRQIFYRQIRTGRGGQSYEIIKFRTMRRNAEADGMPKWASESDERATRVGRFLRKTHLDELPQFINVLRGEMSLVGPRAERPELVNYFQHQVPFYRARLLVKPGLTGWAQVNFGYASSIEDTIIKLEYDLYYIKHRSLLLDLLILLRTPATVFGLRGR
jgi:exopolysaccharide biosynthesis polyprenyl glycosylphosphotransferase